MSRLLPFLAAVVLVGAGVVIGNYRSPSHAAPPVAAQWWPEGRDR